MTEIELKFSKEMAVAALYGLKCCTSRSEKKGEIGDSFIIRSPNNVYNQRFNIIDIWYFPLFQIRDAFYRLEGFATPAEFEETWKALHRGHFSAEKHYYIHFFARCPDD